MSLIFLGKVEGETNSKLPALPKIHKLSIMQKPSLLFTEALKTVTIKFTGYFFSSLTTALRVCVSQSGIQGGWGKSNNREQKR